MFEIANALLILRRRRRIDAEEHEKARLNLAGLNPTVDDERVPLALGEISESAQQHALSTNDAASLELAARRGLPLATRASALHRAAKLSRSKLML